MKTLRLPILVLSIVLFITSCRKSSSHPTDKNGLPAITQSGTNTLGFLLNGKPRTSVNRDGLPQLSANYDPLYQNGVVGVSCYWKFSENNTEYFGLGVSADMNVVKIPATYVLTHAGYFNVVYYSSDTVDLHSADDTTYCSGSMTLSKFDTEKGVLSGIFNVVLASPYMDTVHITDGRFDIKL